MERILPTAFGAAVFAALVYLLFGNPPVIVQELQAMVLAAADVALPYISLVMYWGVMAGAVYFGVKLIIESLMDVAWLDNWTPAYFGVGWLVFVMIVMGKFGAARHGAWFFWPDMNDAVIATALATIWACMLVLGFGLYVGVCDAYYWLKARVHCDA